MLKAIKENHADDLRAQMMQFMKDNVESYHHLGDEVTNADMPEHVLYSSVEESTNSMAHPDTMVGEMEILATEKVLKRTIIIEDTNGNAINKFASTQAPENMPITLQFKNFDHYIGHYDCVTADMSAQTKTKGTLSTEAIHRLIEKVAPKPKTTKPRAHKRKSQSAGLLTPFPFKDMLLEKEAERRKKTISKKTQSNCSSHYKENSSK